MSSSLSERFGSYHKEKNTFRKGETLLVALSGGKDSVCLLHLLKLWQEKFGYRMVACHVNHMIRGEEALRDLTFCQRLCEALDIPFVAKETDVPAFCAANGFGIEEGARLERYRLLQEVSGQFDRCRIVTAHSASDQAETVLFRIIRGTGMAGACGIPKERDGILRPLLPFHKEEILEFAENRQLSFTEDSTNSDILYTRNRLRNEILPKLEEINPAVEKALVRFGAIASSHRALTSALCDLWQERTGADPFSKKVALSVLTPLLHREAGMPLLYEIFARMAQDENITIDFDRFSHLVSLLKCPAEGKIIEISSSFVFILRGGMLVFQKYENKCCGIEYKRELKTGENKLSELEQTLLISEETPQKNTNINKKHLIIHMASDKIEGALFARNFLPGDKVTMYGMTKSIKKLLCDAGIPADLRCHIPLICDEKEVLWLPFIGLCDKARPEEADAHVTLSLSGGRLNEIASALRMGKSKSK